METGLIGVFSARDLLLFYLFFEVALVPMYFIIGIWGHERRRYAAIKFFLYTRAGSLAMLLSFLALYLAARAAHLLPAGARRRAALSQLPGRPAGAARAAPRLRRQAADLPPAQLAARRPRGGADGGERHPGRHPAEDGGLRPAGRSLPLLLPQAVREYGWVLLALGIVSLVYGALAALAQRDFKRLVAYTSINHMGYVMVGAGRLGRWPPIPGCGSWPSNGAVLQTVSHGLLTGGMFFLVGYPAAGDRDPRPGALRRPARAGCRSTAPCSACSPSAPSACRASPASSPSSR